MALATRGSEVSRTNRKIGRLMNQVLAEYTEMPGLSVTLPQAQRLWAVDCVSLPGGIAPFTPSVALRVTTEGRFIQAWM